MCKRSEANKELPSHPKDLVDKEGSRCARPGTDLGGFQWPFGTFRHLLEGPFQGDGMKKSYNLI